MSLEGQRLGEFEILERIGQGGMGAVYKAVQTSLQRTVAIKTLQPSLAGDPDFIERFHREAIAAAGLSHQNLVQVYAAGENDGLHWFAMEFVKGESAYTRLKRKGCIEAGEAIAMAVHLSNALDYAWKRARLIHRDIKPDNIFLSGEGEVKLGDLGLAKVAEQSQQLTVTGSSMGTPHYVSPEQAQGKKDVDLRADIYSLGCTLYHLVSGQTPFTGDNAMSVMMLHVTTPPPDIRGVFPSCPRVLAEVILKMMQKDPAARQQNYGEVIADLRRAFNAMSARPMPVVAPRVAAAPRSMVPSRRKSGAPVAAWVGGAVAACVAVGALLYFAPWKKGGQLSEAERAEKAREQAAGGAGAPRTLPSSVAQETRDGARVPPSPATATKGAPFVNTLGQAFVPVPGTAVLFCRWETRVKDYAVFAKANKVSDAWKTAELQGVPVSREAEHPVVQVSWDDANAFCKWLTEKETAERKLPKGMKYRLPTDEEWSRAVGLAKEEGATPSERAFMGTNQMTFPWGNSFPPKAKVENYADSAFHDQFPTRNWIEDYTDGYATTAPVGSFPPSDLGICDLGGNVAELCGDWLDTRQKSHVFRGNGYDGFSRSEGGIRWELWRSSTRTGMFTGTFLNSVGFRVVLERTLPVPPPASRTPAPTAPTASNALPTETKDKPFVNSLGMKFVPVPITGGPTSGKPVLFSVWETRVRDYEAFAKETKREWPNPGFAQAPEHPAVMVTWDDAQLFCKWLTERERKAGRLTAAMSYRLPSDHEWSCAVGIGEREQGAETPAEKSGKLTGVYPWGTQWPPPEKAGNYAGEEMRPALAAGKYPTTKEVIGGYRDGFVETAPVGSFVANRFGLFDLGGNAWEWCEASYDNELKSVLRGASWDNFHPSNLLSSFRLRYRSAVRGAFTGFRVVLEGSSLVPTASVDPPAPVLSITLPPATREKPFENSIGMKFVPVPIIGGPTNGQRVLFSVWETRVKDYEVFAKETKRERPNPGFEQTPDHPAVGVSWEDAQAFCAWLTERERKAGKLGAGEHYRLPTDHEWSCAVGIGEGEQAEQTPAEKNGKLAGVYPWGTQWPPPEKAGNYRGEELRPVLAAGKYRHIKDVIAGYRDAFVETAPVGSFAANQFGLFDLGGNASEWCEDWIWQIQEGRVLRGGAWSSSDPFLQSSIRNNAPPSHRQPISGFRCVLAAPQASAPTGPK